MTKRPTKPLTTKLYENEAQIQHCGTKGTFVMELKLNAKNHDYSIYIEENILKDAGLHAKKLTGEKVFLVTDSHVFPLYYNRVKEALEQEGLLVACYVIPAGESSKSLSMLGTLYEECVKANITRTDLIIALGGGVVGDLTGFLAATYLRGVNLMQIPTTFLAQIDSSVGGKTAIDLPSGKNLAGAFYQPKIVLIDPRVLSTLTDEIFADGMAEAVKYACIRDKEMLPLLENPKENLLQIITRSVTIKKTVVERDEFDLGERMILNFGHTVGHAIEKMGNYTEYTHGQAVAIGMACILKMGQILGKVTQDEVQTVIDLLIKSNLPVSVPYHAEQCLKTVSSDKKMAGKTLNAVFPDGLGNCTVEQWTVDEFNRLAKETGIFTK